MERLAYGGCIFCSEKGSGDHLQRLSIEDQVKNYFNSYKSQRANKFIVYFQNFTNTYDSVENLKEKYDSSLIDSRIVGLEIATRPDCITEEIAQLLINTMFVLNWDCKHQIMKRPNLLTEDICQTNLLKP